MTTTANGATHPMVVFALLKVKTVLTMESLLTHALVDLTLLVTHAKMLLDVLGVTLLPSVTTKVMLLDVTYIKWVTPHVLNTVKTLAPAALFATLCKVVFGVVTLKLVLMLMLLLARDNQVVRNAKVTDIVILAWTRLVATGARDLNLFALPKLALPKFLKLMTACLTVMV